MPTRTYEIAALRPDGSIYFGQHRAPATALFDNAFAAFARGTLIATPKGEISIEDIQPGDEVCTADGGTDCVVWVGSSSFGPSGADRPLTLTRIMPESLGENRPHGCLTLGPAARLLRRAPEARAAADERQLLSPARCFHDGVNMIELAQPTAVRLFHLCLSRHAVITASGVEVESYHPGDFAGRAPSDTMREVFLDMFPHIRVMDDFGPLAFERAPDEGTLAC